MPENPCLMNRVDGEETTPANEMAILKKARSRIGRRDIGLKLSTVALAAGLIGNGILLENKKTLERDVGSTCEKVASGLDTPIEELSKPMKALRELCEKHGFIKIHQPNE